MINLGMIGMNEGNGHPYSFSAVFNGYNDEALERKCPFEIIRKYLREHHRNQEFIGNARVSCIWTQDRALSENAARIANIPSVADSIEELAGNVDAIIFARDDIWNHWEMAGKLFQTGKPIYMDKLLAHNQSDLNNFLEAAGSGYPLMTASSFRFAPEVEKAEKSLAVPEVKTVYGISPVSWIRYAPHLLDPLFRLFGRDIESVQNCGRELADTVCLTYRNGLQAVLQVLDGVSLPIGLTCHSGKSIPPYAMLYTDPTLESYFYSIVNMMKAFVELIETGKRTESFNETVFLNKIVLAGIASREAGGRKIMIDEVI